MKKQTVIAIDQYRFFKNQINVTNNNKEDYVKTEDDFKTKDSVKTEDGEIIHNAHHR